MDEFWDSVGGTGHLKAGMLGFAGSGKTHTAVLLAIAARERLRLDGPISMFDTEGGSPYVRDVVEGLTGKDFLVKRARSFDDLMAWATAIRQAGVSVGIVDSITHPWAELTEAYLVQKNEALVKAGKVPVKRLDFADWNVIKPAWNVWTNFYLNAPISLIVCGRAGFEWAFEENDEGKKELRKVGIKMKTEGEFGFEPSLLIQMERVQDLEGNHATIQRTATVLKDRFNRIDGKTLEFPSELDAAAGVKKVGDAFAPHLERLTPGGHSPVDSRLKTEFNIDESGDAGWARERRERTILAEEIQGELVSAMPGQTAVEKKEKADLLQGCFGTRSWAAIENMDSRKLREGLSKLREILLARIQARHTEEVVTNA